MFLLVLIVNFQLSWKVTCFHWTLVFFIFFWQKLLQNHNLKFNPTSISFGKVLRTPIKPKRLCLGFTMVFKMFSNLFDFKKWLGSKGIKISELQIGPRTLEKLQFGNESVMKVKPSEQFYFRWTWKQNLPFENYWKLTKLALILYAGMSMKDSWLVFQIFQEIYYFIQLNLFCCQSFKKLPYWIKNNAQGNSPRQALSPNQTCLSCLSSISFLFFFLFNSLSAWIVWFSSFFETWHNLQDSFSQFFKIWCLHTSKESNWNDHF